MTLPVRRFHGPGVLPVEAADPHGTGLTDISADNTTVTRRAYTPFGQDRTAGGNPTTWPGDQGFVGGTPDPITGLTNLGARAYDPALGRFLSVDPVLDMSDPQSLNGYAYADNTPVDASDPTGLRSECGQNGDSACSTDASPAGGGFATNYHGADTNSCGKSNPDPKPKKKSHSWTDVVGDAVSVVGDTLGTSTNVVRDYTEAILTNQDVFIEGRSSVAGPWVREMGAVVYFPQLGLVGRVHASPCAGRGPCEFWSGPEK